MYRMYNVHLSQGALDLMDTAEHRHGEELPLPGVTKGDFSRRRVSPQIDVHDVQFCPTGKREGSRCLINVVYIECNCNVIISQGRAGVLLPPKDCSSTLSILP